MEQQEHKRRERYKGTHPRRFEEKYKELNPEAYREDVQKVIARGQTPAGTHIPIMVEEILGVLRIRPGETGCDATLGYGGHASKMLEQLEGQGHLYAIDVDTVELEKTRRRLLELGFGEDILTVRHMNFAALDEVAPGVKFDFVLADLGVSSMQIDNPKRGFSFKQDGPLDLRLDPAAGVTGAERLAELSEEELAAMLVENADEPYAERIARAVVRMQGKTPITTTRQLVEAVGSALWFLPKGEREQAVKSSCQRTFQALRIDVNSEFEALYSFLEKLPSVLAAGGRAAVLTFHSGEDRLVKKAFKSGLGAGVYSAVSDGVVRPTPEECYNNPRARSTKLRWAIRA